MMVRSCLTQGLLEVPSSGRYGSRAYFCSSTPDTHCLHAYLWLFKTYVIPAGMYASQIWATAYLQKGTEMDNCIQKSASEILEIHAGCTNINSFPECPP
eukprot:1160762-Pelagomonas_calceolata.AAC.8